MTDYDNAPAYVSPAEVEAFDRERAAPGPKGQARVCGSCYIAMRPGEYEPSTFIPGRCDVCGADAFVHRVRRAEVVEQQARDFAVAHGVSYHDSM